MAHVTPAPARSALNSGGPGWHDRFAVLTGAALSQDRAAAAISAKSRSSASRRRQRTGTCEWSCPTRSE